MQAAAAVDRTVLAVLGRDPATVTAVLQLAGEKRAEEAAALVSVEMVVPVTWEVQRAGVYMVT